MAYESDVHLGEGIIRKLHHLMHVLILRRNEVFLATDAAVQGAMEGKTDADGLEMNGSHKLDLLTEDEYIDIIDNQISPDNDRLSDDDPNKFIAKMGAEAIYELLQKIDLDSLSYELRDHANNDSSQQRKTEALKRLQVVESFRASKGINKPEWMIMKIHDPRYAHIMKK